MIDDVADREVAEHIEETGYGDVSYPDDRPASPGRRSGETSSAAFHEHCGSFSSSTLTTEHLLRVEAPPRQGAAKTAR
ncbi:hypothetical protein C6N75_07500 [Streptomyces solincola]|uniref:Uncharacterized protein n=1 Tax=Streptomyces solincola TaxID=2100817 RepID=A0A2S9PZL6_9ACTN|nr:hypothetical protein C6N75_07500 [Streptomyces solincola]